MRDDRPDHDAAGRPVLLRAVDLFFGARGDPLFEHLSFRIVAGLTLVRGGEGRGKSTLLRLIAGEQAPGCGRLDRSASPVFQVDPRDPRDDDLTARDWLHRGQVRFPAWSAARQVDLADRFELLEHLDKRLFMLSTGTRRKLWLTAAFACGAPLVLLDMPYAALDGPARDVLTGLLADGAADPDRGCVIADHELPAALASVPLACTIDLGD
jgi:ABC-type transport system involved in cytochrome c biogenesis ATPase subunit